MYEKFTEGAREVMRKANEHAHQCNHEYIGPEHVLLALLDRETCRAYDILRSFGIDHVAVTRELRKGIRDGAHKVTMEKLPQTPRMKRVIEYAMEESRSLQHNYVGTEHLLLGILRERENVAANVLASPFEVTLERTRITVRDSIAPAKAPERRKYDGVYIFEPPCDAIDGMSPQEVLWKDLVQFHDTNPAFAVSQIIVIGRIMKKD